MADFSHFNEDGRARMVDVGGKDVTKRTAVAVGRVLVNRECFDLIKSGGMKKGDVLGTAQIAGIMGAKKTSEVIPMCHPIMINGANITFHLNEEDLAVEIQSEVKCSGVTGVEMEALTADVYKRQTSFPSNWVTAVCWPAPPARMWRRDTWVLKI